MEDDVSVASAVPMGADGDVVRNCPACGASGYRVVRDIGDHFTGKNYPVVRCDACALMYLRSAPDVSRIGEHYANYAGRNMLSRPLALFGWLRDVAFGLEYGQLVHLLQPEDRVLELGTGDGALAEYLLRRRRNVVACDVIAPEDWHLPQVPYLQVDINHLTGETVRGARAIVMRHVFEHVHYPAALLQLFARERVRYVHILVPNCASPFVGFFGEDWCSWDPPRHLQFFEAATLDNTARQCGYSLHSTTDHGIDEVVVSLFRRKMLQWQRSAHAGTSPESELWFRLLQPKGLLCTLSAALSGFLVKSVLSRLYVLGDRQ